MTEHEDAAASIREAMDAIRRLPPFPRRVEVTPKVYDALKRKAWDQAEERNRLGLYPDPPWWTSANLDIPILVKDDVPPPGWAFIYPEETGDMDSETENYIECPDCEGRGLRPPEDMRESALPQDDAGDIECPQCGGTGVIEEG